MSEPDGMIERVVAALDADRPWVGPAPMPQAIRSQRRALVRAVLEAMREPTEAMVEAGRVGMERNEFRDGWAMAIDRALLGD